MSFSDMFQRKKWQILPTSTESCVEKTTVEPSQCFRNLCRLLRKTAGQQVSHQAAGQLVLTGVNLNGDSHPIWLAPSAQRTQESQYRLPLFYNTVNIPATQKLLGRSSTLRMCPVEIYSSSTHNISAHMNTSHNGTLFTQQSDLKRYHGIVLMQKDLISSTQPYHQNHYL